MSSQDSSNHSDPIPINSNRSRSRSLSENSDSDSLPPLSPSQSPASATSVSVQTPLSTSARNPASPISPSSPILSYFYGAPNKNPFGRPFIPSFEDEESQEPPPTPASPHGRRMSSSWIPPRFAPQPQTKNTTETQPDRGVGVLRRLSISNPLAAKPQPALPKQDGGTRGKPGQHRKSATLSAGTVGANNKPRAPSPMGERMLKGHYDGF